MTHCVLERVCVCACVCVCERESTRMTRRSVNGEGTGVNNTPQNGGHPGDTPAPKEEPDAPNGKVELRKKVTLLQGISIIIGTIIGAGIFISPKGILKNSGSVGMSLVVWIACGVLSLFGESHIVVVQKRGDIPE